MREMGGWQKSTGIAAADHENRRGGGDEVADERAERRVALVPVEGATFLDVAGVPVEGVAIVVGIAGRLVPQHLLSLPRCCSDISVDLIRVRLLNSRRNEMKLCFGRLSDNLLHEGGCNYHFYLAVDRYQFKMETLMDLLGAAGRRPGFPMVVCCSSHDELDAASSAVANVPCISLASLLMVSKVIIFEAYDNLFGSSERIVSFV
ncbi:hypothetical protein TB1_039057 [Malus domestica]